MAFCSSSIVMRFVANEGSAIATNAAMSITGLRIAEPPVQEIIVLCNAFEFAICKLLQSVGSNYG
jgi:hypothetical protein